MFMMLFAFFNKAEAQMQGDTTITSNHKGYKVEIDGLYYDLDAVSMTASLIDCVDTTKHNCQIPSSIQYGGKVFVVNSVHFPAGYYDHEHQHPMLSDYSFVKTITIPDGVSILGIGSLGISTLNIPSSVEEFYISGANNLKKLTIPKTVINVGCIQELQSIDSIIFEDGDIPIGFNNAAWDTRNFKGIQNEYLYIGRQIWGHVYFDDMGNYFDGCGEGAIFFDSNGHYPREVQFGPYVKDIRRYQPLYLSSRIIIPNTVEKGIIGHCAEEIVFEDGLTNYVVREGYDVNGTFCHQFPTKSLYIGRPGTYDCANFQIERLTIGPLLTPEQASSFFCSVYSSEPSCSVTGDSAYIKLYQVIPPLIDESDYWYDPYFDDETFIHTPLYVPRGSKTLYEQADTWKSFFNIIEFDLDLPEHDVQLLNSHPEYGYVTGAGNYHFGQTATLTAVPSEGHVFQCWMENGEVISRSNPYSFVVDRDRIITANFDGTGVDDNFSQNRINVSVKDRIISIEADGASVILAYNIQGQCVYRGYEKEFYVPCAGLYIVSIENKRIKVVVK